jgi:hypothetical protein
LTKAWASCRGGDSEIDEVRVVFLISRENESSL